jgi:hypothetical protein
MTWAYKDLIPFAIIGVDTHIIIEQQGFNHMQHQVGLRSGF